MYILLYNLIHTYILRKAYFQYFLQSHSDPNKSQWWFPLLISWL